MEHLQIHYQAEFVFDPVENPRRLELKTVGVQGNKRFTPALKTIITSVLKNSHNYDSIRELAIRSDTIDRVVIAIELLSDDVEDSSIRASLGQLLELFVVGTPDRLDAISRSAQVESPGKYRFFVTNYQESCIISNDDIAETTFNGIRAEMEGRFDRSGNIGSPLDVPSDQIRIHSLNELIKLAQDDPAKREQIREALQQAAHQLEIQPGQTVIATPGEPAKSLDIPSLIEEGSRLLERFSRRNEPSVKEFQTYLDLLAQTKFKSETRDAETREMVIGQRKEIVDRVNRLRALIGVALFLDEPGQPRQEVVNIDLKKIGNFRFRGQSHTPIQENARWPKLKVEIDLRNAMAVDSLKDLAELSRGERHSRRNAP